MHHRSFDELVGRFENPKRATWQKPDLVLQKLGLVKGKTVVDIGAGTGYFSVRLAALGALVIAEDIDQRFLDYITQRLPNVKNGKSITPRLGAADDPKLEKASVDFALFVDVYHHIEQRRQYLEHVIEALRPGGKLLVVDFKPGDFPEGPPDALKLPVEEVVRELKEAGFTRIELDLAELPYQYLVQAGRP
jgi:SAM-dependent methyltransferase